MAAKDRNARLKGGHFVTLADGTRLKIPAGHEKLFRGLTSDGNLIYAADWDHQFLYALTPCCYATAKGSEDGTVCRNCYREVDPLLGGDAHVASGKALASQNGDVGILDHVDLIPSADGTTYRITPVWIGVDRPATSSWILGNKSVAERLQSAVLAGAVCLDPHVKTDVNGQTYVTSTSAVLAKYANADLRRLGY